MKIQSRKVLRQAIKASMTPVLVGPTNVAQIIYQFQTGEFNDKLADQIAADVSVFVITSDGSDIMFEDSRFISPEQIIYINIHSFVLYEKVAEDGTVEWTEEQSEDQIDAMQQALVEWLISNIDRRDEAVLPPWLEIDVVGKSSITSAFIAGKEYRHEDFNLKFTVANQE